MIASHLESVTLSELCWLVISKREGIEFLEEEGFHFPFVSWGTCWQELRQNIAKWQLQPCKKGLFLTQICSVTAFAAWPCLKKTKTLLAKLRLLCAAMWEWEGEVRAGIPSGSGASDACVMKICLQLTIVLWPQSMLKQGLCIIMEGDGSCSKRCYVLNFQNRQRRHCQPFTHGKQRRRERGLSGASRLILTEWALKVKFPEFICVLWPQDWPSFLILDFVLPATSVWVNGCSSKTFFYSVLFNKYARASFLGQNCAASKSVQVPVATLQTPQRASGGFSCWDCQEQ